MDILISTYNELIKECKYEWHQTKVHQRAMSARRWILDESINMCLNHLDTDPLKLLKDYLVDIWLIRLEVTETNAKLVYDNAFSMLQEIIDNLNIKLKKI